MGASDTGVASATAGLLWAASRPAPDLAAVHAALDAGADVSRAVEVALEARTGPLLWRALESAGRLDDLGDDRELLFKEWETRKVQAALLLPIAVATALRPLLDDGLEPVVFKGPAIALRYPSPGLRPMDDIDVLLPPEHHERGRALLERAGWTVFEREGRHHDTVLTHAAIPDLALELHLGLESWRDQAHRLTSGDLWRVRVPFDCLGTPAFGLPPATELVALAAHAGKPFHHFERLIWSVDIAVLIDTAGSSLDWDAVGDLARRAGCSTVVSVALHHARRLGADVPGDLLVLPTGRYRYAAVAPLVEETWPLATPDVGEVHRLRYALCDERTLQLRLLAGEITRAGALRTPGRLLHVLGLGVRRWTRWRRTPPPARPR